MSKYFEEIPFTMPSDPGEPEKPKVILVVDKDELKKAVKQIEDELEKIKTGQSNLVTYAISTGAFGSPAENRLRILIREPSKENITAFIELCKQDFNRNVADHFKKLLIPTIKEVNNDEQ